MEDGFVVVKLTKAQAKEVTDTLVDRMRKTGLSRPNDTTFINLQQSVRALTFAKGCGYAY